jgi:hypothetical protein
MAFSLTASVTKASTNGNGTTTTATSTLGANLIVVSLSTFGGVADPVFSDNRGNPYTKLTTHNSSIAKTVIYYTAGPTISSASHTFTSGGVGNFPTIHMLAFVGATSAAGVFSSATGSVRSSPGTNIASGSTGNVNAISNDQLFISGVNSHQNLSAIGVGVNTIDSGFTVVHSSAFVPSQHLTTAIAYKIQTISNSENATWAFPSAYQPTNNYAANIAVFNPAVVSTPPNSGFFMMMW